MATVAVVGSTGSIGTQTLDVVAAEAGRFEITAIGAHSSVDLLAEQAAAVRPQVVALADENKAGDLADRLPKGIELRAGDGALASLAAEADTVVNAVVGFAGLGVTVETLRLGRRLALANKESLIAGGPVVAKVKATGGGEIIPVDSEHAAVHQCLRGNPVERVARIVLTASGGPFRGRSREELAQVTVDDALAHPTWRMGPKITVDSSTLMNKGLEVIEAHELFGVDYDRIEVVVHPQSIVHSMVEYTDASTIAQLSNPDMRLPIGYALAYPDRIASPFGTLDWTSVGRLEFEAPDLDAFPCLGLAFEAGRVGGSAPAWLNAANEVAVAAFLDGLMSWLQIAEVIKDVMQVHNGEDLSSVDEVVAADHQARAAARQAVERRTRAA
ncbi:MAG TPA: 1-deoxy-D-xylulose-5-phosphate reductoisomerase [Acidimicrobiales bacterium]|nr:1-deoxy-D-xylulose-5-phosphate reductoisomerase [Acidimicrobiales bacterium]